MSVTNGSYDQDEEQELADGRAVCQVLSEYFDLVGLSYSELERRTGIDMHAIRRMTRNQEPKASQLIRLESAMGLLPGTVYVKAGLIDDPTLATASRVIAPGQTVQPKPNLELLLARSKDLHRTYQRQAVETYRLWKRLSREEAERR